jgi:hypothetical protein
MGQDAAELHVAQSGSVNAAPVGTTMPTTPTASLDAAFIDLGYMTEDGVTFSSSPTVEEIRAWQAADPIRRTVTQRVFSAAISAMQVNQENFVVAYGGGSWSSPSAGIYKYTPPLPTAALAEQAVVVRSTDGSKHNNYNIFRTNVVEAVESSLSRSAAQLLPVNFSALTPSGGGASWEFLTDDAYAFGYLS